MAKLILKFQGAFIKEYMLDKPSIKIGRREGNDIQIDNLAVSGNHAKVQKVNDSYIIVDLKSTNGTFVNRKKVIQAKLNHMDEITIGKHALIFDGGAQQSEQAAVPPKPEVREAEETAAPQEPSHKEVKPAPAPEKLGRLRFLGTGGMPEVMLQKKLAVIGRREDADVRLKGPFAPKVAAFINRKPTGYSILPEEKVRVKINGELVTRQTNLKDGDIIDVGSLKIEFKES